MMNFVCYTSYIPTLNWKLEKYKYMYICKCQYLYKDYFNVLLDYLQVLHMEHLN